MDSEYSYCTIFHRIWQETFFCDDCKRLTAGGWKPKMKASYTEKDVER